MYASKNKTSFGKKKIKLKTGCEVIIFFEKLATLLLGAYKYVLFGLFE